MLTWIMKVLGTIAISLIVIILAVVVIVGGCTAAVFIALQ